MKIGLYACQEVANLLVTQCEPHSANETNSGGGYKYESVGLPALGRECPVFAGLQELDRGPKQG